MAALVGGFFLYRSITTPALSGKDAVVLSSVVNRTGDTMFDDTLGEALALQLRQSPFLNVVPDQQVQATLRQMGRDSESAITADVGREVCQRAGAKALLGGSIAMLGSAYVVTLNAQDCVEGRVLAEEQVQAASKETVLAALGSAVSVFREKLGESLASIQRYDAKIEEATTPSLEALKAYSQALRTRRTTGDFDSVPFFRRAVELDPKFALAYARLGTVYSNLGQRDEARKMTEKAYELRAKVSEVERYYIEARYHSTVVRDPRKALDVYRVWLGAYPNDYAALTNSALLLKELGEFEEALRNQEAATRVAPDQPVAWANLGDTYMNQGRFPDARQALETAVKLQNAAGPRASLYTIGVLTGDMALADEQAAAMAGRREEVDFMRVRIQAALFKGKFKDASNLMAEFSARMEAASRRPQTGEPLMGLAIEEALVGMTAAAKARAEAVGDEDLFNQDTIDEQFALSALTRDAAAARALLPKALAAFQQGGVSAGSELERAVRGLVALAEGRPSETISMLEPVTFKPENANNVTIWSIAQLELKDWESAIKGLTYLTEDTWQRGLGSNKAFAMASLARAQAALGRPDDARKSYQAFFEFWKDADADVPLLLQARDEFSKL